MKNKTERSFIYRIAVPVLMLVVIVGAAAADLVHTRTLTFKRMTETLETRACDQASRLDEQIDVNFALLEGLAGSFTKSELEHLPGILEKMDEFAKRTDFITLDYAYPDGTAYRSDGMKFDISDRWYFAQCLEGKRAIERLSRGKLVDDVRIGVAVPVERDGEIVGVLVGDLEEEAFQNIFETVGNSVSEFSYICDSEGHVIVATEKAEEILEQQVPGILKDGSVFTIVEDSVFKEGSLSEMQENMQNGVSGSIRYKYGTEDRYAIYEKAGTNDWYVISVLSIKDVAAQVMETVQGSYIMLGIVLIAGAIIVLLLLRQEREEKKRSIRENKKLKDILEHDSLTGLVKEKVFVRQCEERLKEADEGEYCIIYLDIYKFKLINEMFGRERGDEMLRILAADMEKFAEKHNGFCCRIAGDRFTMLLPYDKKMINSLVKAANEQKEEWKLPLECFIHFGVYIIRNREVPVMEMIDCAQLGQKTIKGNYDNYVAVYDEVIKKKMLKEQEIISDMVRALEAKEFVVYLQPQYNYRTGEINGAEALVRWEHPTKGLIMPGDFLPIFETNGFITSVDESVWEQTCVLLRRWLDEGKQPVPVSVNISRADFYKGSILDKIGGLVTRYRIPTDLLRLEITESAYMDNPGQLIIEIERLREFGFTVEMDDFGSGYSSLNMLKDLPINVLKTDLKFLESSDHENRKTQILNYVIDMAHQIGLTVVAEGVETKEQAEYLAGLSCETMQGYFFSKPITVEKFEEILYASSLPDAEK